MKKKLLTALAFLLLVLWPLVVHLDLVPTRLSGEPWFPDTEQQADIFMHSRSVLFLTLSFVMGLSVICGILALHRGRKSGRFGTGIAFPGSLKMAGILTGISALLTLLSALFSGHRDMAFWGSFEQYETCWVLLGYLAVFWFFVLFGGVIGEVRILHYFCLGAVLQVLIGIFQTAGHDFWGSGLGKRLLLLGQGTAVDLTFRYAGMEGERVYLSFYHSNYAAVYLVLLLPLALYLALGEKGKGRPGALILSAGLLVCLWGTGSRSGAVAVCGLIVLSAAVWVITRCVGRRRRLISGLLLGVLLAVALFLGNMALHRLPRQLYDLQEVFTGKDEVQITYGGARYALSLEEEAGAWLFSVRDEDGNTLPLDYSAEEELFSLDTGKSGRLWFDAYRTQGMSHLVMYDGPVSWHFAKEDGEGSTYQFYTEYGKPDQAEKAGYVGQEGYETLFSERAYLWSRTIPKLGAHLILGSGPCTFPLEFPKNDYVMRSNLVKQATPDVEKNRRENSTGFLSEVIARPHSMYLQTAIQTGVLSLLVKLLLVVAAGLRGAELYRKSVSRRDRRRRLALAFSALAYLIMGLANDAVVLTAPLFWAVLGMLAAGPAEGDPQIGPESSGWRGGKFE